MNQEPRTRNEEPGTKNHQGMINIHSDTNLVLRVIISLREVKFLCARICAELGCMDPELDILISHDAAMARFNKDFLDMEGPTNVLSFPEDESCDSICGQIIINADAVKREALLYGETPLDCFRRLITHGILHLSGLDHGPEMEAMARRIQEVCHA